MTGSDGVGVGIRSEEWMKGSVGVGVGIRNFSGE